MFVSDDQCSKALDFQRDNANELGRLQGRVKTLDSRLKIVKALNMGDSGSVSDKEAHAYASRDYREAVTEGEQDIASYTALRALIDTAAAKVEVWRSLNARAGRGHA
jgi:hypothetical protein